MVEAKTSNDKEMTLLDHLRELRYRIMICLGFVSVAALLLFSYTKPLIEFINRPFFSVFDKTSLIGTGPAEAFLLRIKVALFGAILATSPAISWQAWKFIEPALYDSEKKQLVPFIFSTSILFLAGTALCYYQVLPLTFSFFKDQYSFMEISPQIKVDENLSLTMQLLLIFGITFDLPVFCYFLGRLGIITSQGMLGSLRYAVLVIVIAAAVLTPPDVISQMMLAGPLLILYLISIFVVRWTEARSGTNELSPVDNSPK